MFEVTPTLRIILIFSVTQIYTDRMIWPFIILYNHLLNIIIVRASRRRRSVLTMSKTFITIVTISEESILIYPKNQLYIFWNKLFNKTCSKNIHINLLLITDTDTDTNPKKFKNGYGYGYKKISGRIRIRMQKISRADTDTDTIFFVFTDTCIRQTLYTHDWHVAGKLRM